MGLFGKSKGNKGLSKSEYYNIIVDMLALAKVLNKDSIRRVIKAKFNDDCEGGDFEKALSKFDTVSDIRSDDIWYRLTFKQADKAVQCTYIKKSEIFDIGFKPFKEKVKAKVEEIIKNLPSNPKEAAFVDEVKNYESSLRLPFENGIPMVLVFEMTVAEVFADYLLAGNDEVAYIAAKHTFRHLRGLKNGEYSYCAFALRAFNYGKFNADKGEYKSITKNDCLELANTCDLFARVDNSVADNILRANTFDVPDLRLGLRRWNELLCDNEKAVDAACFYTWKTLCKLYEKEANTSKEIVDLLIDCINN